MAISTAVAFTVGAAAVSAYGQIQAGQAAQDAANTNAALARMNAAEAERVSRRQSEQLIGSSRAAAAAQGTTLEGSPMMIINDAAAEAEIEALHLRKGGEYQAAAYQKQGSAAKTAAYFQAGSTLLGGAAKAVGYAL